MWAIISAAGWPIWPLIIASIVALAITFERVWSLKTGKWIPASLVEDVCRTLPQFRDKSNLQRLNAHSPLGEVLASGLGAFYQGKDHETAMQEAAAGVQVKMMKHLDLLSLIASAAPLMGLLGTVVGMIEIFAAQGQISQGPEAVAQGISIALYNTAFGLIVAIPALVAYRLFKIRVNNLIDQLGAAIEPLDELLHRPHASSANVNSKRIS